MRFAEIEREFLHHRDAARALSRSMEREWLLRPQSGPVDAQGYPDLQAGGDPGLRIIVTCPNWGTDPTLTLLVSATRFRRWHSASLTDLSMDDLQTVVAARELIERWRRGEIDDLPVEFPRELVAGAPLPDA